MPLSDKVAIVTGASSGIGAAIVRELSGAGARIVLTARRADKLEQLAATLPGRSACLAAEVEAPGTPDALLALALERFGRADILVNNAGVFVAGDVDSIDLDQLAAMTRVNYDAVVRASYVFGRHFKRQGAGAIINVSSIGAYHHGTAASYGALKHALEAFSTSLRVELARSGVRVGTIAPGTTRTEIYERRQALGRTREGHVPLEAQDVAAAVRFMLEQPDRANVARMLLVPSTEQV